VILDIMSVEGSQLGLQVADRCASSVRKHGCAEYTASCTYDYFCASRGLNEIDCRSLRAPFAAVSDPNLCCDNVGLSETV
jgi:hypothetical protein